jgi:hypothetical protein
MSVRVRCVAGTSALLAAIAVCLTAVGPAAAQTTQTAPTLTNETLLSFFLPDGTSPRNVQVTCDRDGNSTLEFTVTGTASGPYNGTFVETATVRIGDQSLLPPVPDTGPFVPYSYGLTTGPILVWDAEFEITPFSGDPTYERVTGFKRVIADAPLNTGFCFELQSGNVPDFPGLLISGYSTAARAELTYQALIETATGEFRDEGTSRAVVREGFLTDQHGDVRARVGEFGERFFSSLTETVPVPLRPGLGCGDRNHEHEREDDCKFEPK